MEHFVLFDFFFCRRGDVVEAQAAVVEPEQAHHAHTTQRSQNTVAAPAIGKQETLDQRRDVNVRAR